MKKINEIIERYKHNLSEKDIQSLFGDYSSFYLKNLKLFLISIIPEF